MSTRLQIVLIGLFALGVGYLAGIYAPLPQPHAPGAAVTTPLDTKTQASAPIPAQADTKNVPVNTLSFGGKNCDIYQTVTSPYKEDESIVVTSKYCFDQQSMFSIFLKDYGAMQQLLAGGNYEFPYNNPYTYDGRALVGFLDADNVIYSTMYGEGAGCSSGGEIEYHKLNLRTGAVDTVAKGGSSSHCHDPKMEIEALAANNAAICWDSSETYSFGPNEVQLFLTCTDSLKTGTMVFAAKLNNKTVLTKNVTDSDRFTFPGVENTIRLLKGSTILQFSAVGTTYSLNLASGKLE